MYDFLCLFPHANASHSLIHYLNQHPGMHVAPYTTVSRSLDDVPAYERNLRPYVSPIGVPCTHGTANILCLPYRRLTLPGLPYFRAWRCRCGIELELPLSQPHGWF
jgi:hypothetical protein